MKASKEPVGTKTYIFEGENGSIARIQWMPYGEWMLWIDGGFVTFERDGKTLFADLPGNACFATYEECVEHLMNNGNVRFGLMPWAACAA